MFFESRCVLLVSVVFSPEGHQEKEFLGFLWTVSSMLSCMFIKLVNYYYYKNIPVLVCIV